MIYDPKTGNGLDLKNAYFNNKAFQAAANGQFQLTDTEENKNANWRFILPDDIALEICTSQFPKLLNLSAIPKPTAGKDLQFDIDISANKADFVDMSENIFFSFGNFEGLGNVSTDKISLSFSSSALNYAIGRYQVFQANEPTTIRIYAQVRV
ncbi:MAG: hypothetical protein V4585_06925 [Bacteroidota bacterium]